MLTDWRNKLSSDIEFKLNKILKRVKMHQNAYYYCKNPTIAQIWVGIAELQNKLDQLDQRLGDIEQIIEITHIKPRVTLNPVLRKSLEEY